MAYEHRTVEPKWQARWREAGLHKTPTDPAKPKFYALDMFPYPSGAGLHVGHCEGYTATDVITRWKRMQGFRVLHPMGWDAFGLPAENYAIKHGVHPRETTAAAIANFRRQIDAVGFAYDWERELDTTDPGLHALDAVDLPASCTSATSPSRASPPINWCPSCKTGLANEEVSQGRCERCGTRRRAQGHAPVDAAHHPLRRSAARGSGRARLAGVDGGDAAQLDRPQRGGRGDIHDRDAGRRAASCACSRRGPDTLYGATYMVLSPEHALVDELTTPAQRAAVAAYQEQARRKSDLERTELAKEKTGVFTGATATNPVNGKQIPIWIADYVLASYGTGAIMAVPAHDERDFEFAKTFGIPIVQVIAPADGSAVDPNQAFTGDGVNVNSGPLDGLPTPEAKKKITAELEARGVGKGAVSYRLRDWVFSRQRYWGEPIPLIHCPTDGVVPVPEAQLPVRLPDVERYEPTGTGESPLAAIESFVNTTCPKCGGPAKRETNTMPQWAGSCWYYLRYLDPKNDDARVRSRGREGVDGRRPVRRRRRARGAAPPLRALLAQGAVRHRRGHHEGAVPEAAPPGDGARVFVRGRDGALPRARRGRAARRGGVPQGDGREAEGRPSRRCRSRR